MDLNTILKKTKNKSDRIKRIRQPVYIAMKERPYETKESTQKEQKETIKNLRQSKDKLETNLGQTRDKIETNLGQTRDKLETQLRTQSKTKVRQSEDKRETNLGQTRDKAKENLTAQYSFLSLVGLQRKLLIFIYKQCQLHRDKVTPPLSMESIATNCNTTISSARKTFQRLEKKALLIRKEFKNGRGGWTQYELPKDIFQELLHSENYSQFETNLRQSRDKVETNLRQSRDKLESQPRTQLRTSTPSSSSNINITTTTKLPDDWINIDLNKANGFGFTQNHLLQLHKRGGYDPKIIEDSIQHFLFDLEHNNKAKEIKTNPLSYFMGILKRVEVYTAPDNYESTKDRAMRIYLEKKRVIHEKKTAMEKELMKISYEDWVVQLSKNEKDNLLSDEIRDSHLQAPKTATLRLHYEKTIWKTEKDKLLQDVMSRKN